MQLAEIEVEEYATGYPSTSAASRGRARSVPSGHDGLKRGYGLRTKNVIW